MDISLEFAINLSIFRYKVFIMIKLEDLKYINSVDKDLGDLTLNMLVASVSVLFEQIQKQDGIKLDLEALTELDAFFAANLDILEESELFEECVKIHYIREAIKLEKEKLTNETENL